MKTMDRNSIKDKTMVINANEKLISNIAGQKSKNVRGLIDEYNLKDIKIYKGNLSLEEIEISINDLSSKIDKKSSFKKYLREKAIIEV